MEYIKRIEKSLKDIDKTSAEMLRDLEYSKGLMSNWKKGTEPSAIKLLRICKYINKSIEYILTGNEEYNLTNDDKKILQLIKQIPENEKNKEIARLELLVEQQEEKENIFDKNKLSV